MPLGARHVEEGWIDVEPGGIVLRLDGGGRWRLDGPAELRRLVGRRVVVEGERDGFDLLAVTALTPAGGPRLEFTDPAGVLVAMLTAALLVALSFLLSLRLAFDQSFVTALLASAVAFEGRGCGRAFP